MKKVTIMRGIPGSGKSTWARNNVVGRFVSADDYFIDNNGVYVFNKDHLAAAHDLCLRNFVYLLDNETPSLVVDNTNVRAFEIAPYYRLAEAFGYHVEIIWLICDPVIAANRCIHGVPIDLVKSMSLSFDPLPSWWNVRIIPC